MIALIGQIEVYQPSYFLVPSCVAALAFATWSLVLSRLTNLKYSLFWRLAVLCWCIAILTGAAFDLFRVQGFTSQSVYIAAVVIRTILWVGCSTSGFFVWLMIGIYHPREMAECRYEKTPISKTASNPMA